MVDKCEPFVFNLFRSKTPIPHILAAVRTEGMSNDDILGLIALGAAREYNNGKIEIRCGGEWLIWKTGQYLTMPIDPNLEKYRIMDASTFDAKYEPDPLHKTSFLVRSYREKRIDSRFQAARLTRCPEDGKSAWLERVLAFHPDPRRVRVYGHVFSGPGVFEIAIGSPAGEMVWTPVNANDWLVIWSDGSYGLLANNFFKNEYELIPY